MPIRLRKSLLQLCKHRCFFCKIAKPTEKRTKAALDIYEVTHGLLETTKGEGKAYLDQNLQQAANLRLFFHFNIWGGRGTRQEEMT